MRVRLASASPRRRMLLEAAGVEVDVHPANVDETRDPANDPVAHAALLAFTKAMAAGTDDVVVAADTVVHRDGAIFEKPADRDEARRHLRALSGGWHDVTTGVCVMKGDHFSSRWVTTRVRFRALGDDDIERYLATGEADDKAGAYGIQGLGAALVAEVQGSYTNVIGLPLEETLAMLRELG